ncbi:hypothetical protein [Mariprofundus ferrooxydans]|uniref:hypothetical protein n=1 Tax=Mariprofundus ferrooxydans TaxID=314344 RepID=UPI00142FD511|nr:hypothetical protein [Mariprofundus ferrooxydans]
MRLLGLNITRARNSGTVSAGQINHSGFGQGIWSPMFGQLQPRSTPPGLYEALREALPILDAAIDRLITIDGTPVIVGDNDALVNEISEWAANVEVNDADTMHGLPAFARQLRNETHEQGFSVGEYVQTSRDVPRLNVADSKAISFGRNSSGNLRTFYNRLTPLRQQLNNNGRAKQQDILQDRFSSSVATSQLTNLPGVIELEMRNKVYMAWHIENGDPYGVSMMRPLPFVAKSLLTIQNGLLNSWERFGDPSYHIRYKASGRVSPEELTKRKDTISTEFASIIAGKRLGESADFVTAVDKDSDVNIKIIGHDGQVLEVEMPARHLLEQIVAKTGLPAWMLGLHFSTAERLAKFQSEVLKQESDTRTDLEAPVLERPVAAMLRARGRTWSNEMARTDDGRLVRRDWRIEYRKPNLADEVAKAQARFMNAQADAVTANAGLDKGPITIRTGQDGTSNEITFHPVTRPHGPMAALNKLEKRPIDNPALDRVENDAISGINAEWDATTEHLIRALGLTDNASNGMTTDGFTFTGADKKLIADEMAAFIAAIFERDGMAQGAMAQAFLRAWAQGVIDGYTMQSLNAPVGELSNDAAVAKLMETSTKSFSTWIDNKLTPRIHNVLSAAVESGENPLTTAASLRREFGGAKWKWEQIARSEVALTHADAKHEEWRAEIDDGAVPDAFDWIPAPDACPVCQALTSGNPYTLAALPKPVASTHPSDRCTTAPAAPK